MDAKVTVLVSDDLLVSLQGKFSILGLYTGDIGINSNVTVAPQLIFTFIVEMSLDDVPSSMTFEVTLPGESTRQMTAPVGMPLILPERKRFVFRHPFLVVQPTLRPGRIEGKVTFEGGEILATIAWIAYSAPLAPPKPLN